jgi:hypothetical protein
MARAPRLLTALVLGGAVLGLAPCAGADPQAANSSADSVIDQLQKQGFAVEVNGGPVGDVSMLTTCTVTSIHHPGGPMPAPMTTPMTTGTVNVEVACPLVHG